MALRTKWSYVEEVMLELRDQFIGRDMQLDQREVLLKLDQLVNEFAKNGEIENWKRGYGDGIDDQFITSFEWLTVTDPTNKGNSYVQIPAHYTALADNKGIDQVYFKNDFSSSKKKYFDPVIIMSFKDIASYRNTMGSTLEGRIACYPRGGILYFDRGEINAKYGEIGMRLVVRDSGAIDDNAPYPIPAEIEKRVINELVAFYRERMSQPSDNIKDATSIESKG